MLTRDYFEELVRKGWLSMAKSPVPLIVWNRMCLDTDEGKTMVRVEPGQFWMWEDGETFCIGSVTDTHVLFEHEDQSPTPILREVFESLVYDGKLSLFQEGALVRIDMPDEEVPIPSAIPTVLDRCDHFLKLADTVDFGFRSLLFEVIVTEALCEKGMTALAEALHIPETTLQKWQGGYEYPDPLVMSFVVESLRTLSLQGQDPATQETTQEPANACAEERSAVLPDGALPLDLPISAKNDRSRRNFGVQATFSEGRRPVGVSLVPQGDPDPV